MRVLITGHTGFKGSWLTLYLRELGHEIHGLSLPAPKRSAFHELSIEGLVHGNYFQDIRDIQEVLKIVEEVRPEVIVHLAAQALVLKGYENPIETFEINSIGTANILTSAIQFAVPNVLVITTDKVYDAINFQTPFDESDILGATDPYGKSKVIADLSAQYLMKFQERSIISVARGGNVIGGGDYGQKRLIPDLFSALERNSQAEIRFPQAIRPWQHVLDCISGYWKIIEHGIYKNKGDVWNIGPLQNSQVSVEVVCSKFIDYFGPNIMYFASKTLKPETPNLQLDCRKAIENLNWRPKLEINEALEWTFEWYKSKLKGENLLNLTLSQIHEYLKIN